MAKTAKLKKPTKPPSAHSRASRRVSPPSPNLNTPQTTHTPRPRPQPDPLAPHAHDKITKPKKKGGKILKRKQKLRLEHGREKAEAVMEKMEKKVERAGGRREGIKGRNTGWDELNERIGGRRGRRRGGGGVDEGWEDEEVGDAGGGLDGEKGGGDGDGDGVGEVGFVEDEIL